MPLVIFCGYPSSGKTTRALELQSYLERFLADLAANDGVLPEQFQTPAHPKRNTEIPKMRPKVLLFNDNSFGLVRNEAYQSATEEKKTRGALMSAIERHLTKEDIVICDGMNYIKGFRYQLYCVARALGTPHCAVHCAVSKEQADSWNNAREADSYDPALFEDLCSRFEEPDARNRWDAPLFTVLASDSFTERFGPDIIDAVVLRRPPQPNLSTVVKPSTETNYLYEMDKTTQEIVNALLEAQKGGWFGGDVVVPKTKVKVHISSKGVTLSELRRLRRQFQGLNKMHTQLDMEKVAEGFANYLNTMFSEASGAPRSA
ncbi:chromatin associated protein KTI12 [Polychytrium aggregatum]|uniref:chromatin associated protein KTI12 n=1 Tax=Polychytrium aggregatum TaxID=110093 RepID=UPI0022FECC08|nr:chromatin associated protein KTI12 [Polychytrium aggregatum]KAI9199353.1 chromatin associated protein KTI12 [Polychytrium aggregatum]